MLMYVLNPAGTLRIDLAFEGLHGTFYDPIAGAVLGTFDPPSGESIVALPPASYEHGMVIRIRAERAEPPTAVAHRAGAAIEADGDLSEWEAAEFLRLAPPADYQVLDEAAAGETDVSADFAFLWDEEALYVAVVVTDDVHHNGEAGEQIWSGDSLQVAFDTALNGGIGYDTTDDFELGWALAQEALQSYRWYAPDAAPPERSTAGVARELGETRYEVRIPRAELMLDGLAAGRELAMSVMVNDHDGGAADRRDGWLEWTPGIGREKAPAFFGRLRLEP
jgi:hypothetical protein